MRILFASNSSGSTGAPKMMYACASVLSKELAAECAFTAPYEAGVATDPDNRFRYYLDSGLSFREKVDLAKKIIIDEEADAVFANSIRVCCFAVAANELGIKSILYIHEMGDSFSIALRVGDCTLDLHQFPDIILWASERSRSDWSAFVNGTAPGVVLEPCYLSQEKPEHSSEATEPELLRKIRALKFFVGSVGTICHRKGFDRFVALAKLLPMIPFVWVGDFDRNDPKGAAEFMALSKESKNLVLVGRLDSPWDLLRHANLALFLSREDPNPLTIIEASHFGVRFLATIDGLGERRLPYISGGALPDFDPDFIAETIKNYAKKFLSSSDGRKDYSPSRFASVMERAVRNQETFSRELLTILRGFLIDRADEKFTIGRKKDNSTSFSSANYR